MKQRILAGFLALTALTLPSCFRENWDDCPPEWNTTLRVVTDYEAASRGAAEAGWYDGRIECVTIYAFDENDRFVASWSGGAYTVGQNYEARLSLPKGHSYHFVAWTNCGDTYAPSHTGSELKGLSHDELSMVMNIPADRILRSDIPHRHHGTLDNAAIVAGGDNTHEIIVSPHTYKVNFIVEGQMPAGASYEVGVTDRNTHHTFGLAHVDGKEAYRHVRPLTATGGSRADGGYGVSMILLQIGDDTGTSFDLVNAAEGGATLFTGDLLETIKESYDLDDAGLARMLNDVYEYDVIFTLNAGLDISATVEAWGYRDNETDL